MNRNFQNKPVTVLGLGASGDAAARLLLREGACVSVLDGGCSPAVEERARRLREAGATVEISVTRADVGESRMVVLSPGISMESPLVAPFVEKGIPVIGEVELGSGFCEKPVVAITGTNGKSTTTELVAAALTAGGMRTVACGNIGRALCEVILDNQGCDAYSLEVSSFQLETVDQFRPRVSVYLNLTPDHLDRYASMQQYQSAKWNIFRNQLPGDVAVVNAGCELPETQADRVTFSATQGVTADYTFESGWLCVRGERILEQNKTGLIGPHQAENQLATLAVGDAFGVEREAVIDAMVEYRALPHRCEVVAEQDGVLFVNDSKATNVDAMVKAIQAQSRPVVLIAGGKDKGLDYSGIMDGLKDRLRAAILIGETKEEMARIWSPLLCCEKAVDLEEAVIKAKKTACDGDVVLLSPGCSSFDMFRSYEERGNQYKQIITEQRKQ